MDETHEGEQGEAAAGRAVELAELVRDGERSERAARLSHGERQVYLQARRLLVRELCSARGLDADEAEAWIEAQLALSGKNGD